MIDNQISDAFRQYLFPADHPRLAKIRGLNIYEYRDFAANTDPFTADLVAGWSPMYGAPFQGVTTDGQLIPDLYQLSSVGEDEKAPIEPMVSAAQQFLNSLTADQREKVVYPEIDDTHWQLWANPEFLQHDNGLRLEHLNAEQRDLALAVIAASLSEQGNSLVRNCMKINGLLGDIVDLQQVMNEFSYNFSIFGNPSYDTPWGWQLFGHHVALNVVLVGEQMVATPVFFGAEPNYIDHGAFDGAPIFADRIQHGYTAMAALTDEERKRVIAYHQLVDPAMPAGRVHPGDERHLAGAFQDNRMIPYEGVRVADLGAQAQKIIQDIVADTIGYLPAGVALRRQREIEAYWQDTYFVWYGGWQPGDVYYCRIQSPVLIAELDHHCGVFLDIKEPKPFHIHTVMRTPNGADYARELVRQFQNSNHKE